MMPQILTTAFFSLAWTCLYLPAIIIADLNHLNKPMMYAVLISLFCYHLNNVKFFYISIVACRGYRETFIKACLNLASCCIRQQQNSRNTNNSPTTRINNCEKIPLQSM
jgi:hypothetical protein